MNNQDYEFQEALQSLGENRPTSIVLSYMRTHNTVKSAELEHETGLRQPEVSIAMRALGEHGWIKVTNGKLPGKGRPYNVYTLAVGMDAIIGLYQMQADVKAKEQLKLIQTLKEMPK